MWGETAEIEGGLGQQYESLVHWKLSEIYEDEDYEESNKDS